MCVCVTLCVWFLHRELLLQARGNPNPNPHIFFVDTQNFSAAEAFLAKQKDKNQVCHPLESFIFATLPAFFREWLLQVRAAHKIHGFALLTIKARYSTSCFTSAIVINRNALRYSLLELKAKFDL